MVDEHDVFALGTIDADVAGPARPAGVLLVYNADVGVLRGDLVEEGGSVVGGPIIDEYNLVLGAGRDFADHRPDAVADVRPGIVDRDDHADFSRTSPTLRSATLCAWLSPLA